MSTNCKYCGKYIKDSNSFCSRDCGKYYRNSQGLSPYEEQLMRQEEQPVAYNPILHPNIHPSWTGKSPKLKHR